MKIYKVNKNGPMTYIIIAYLSLLAVLFVQDTEDFSNRTHWYIAAIFPMGLGLCALFHTYYQIKDDKLIYRSGFIHGEIDINNIKEIIKGKTMWVGLKPAL